MADSVGLRITSGQAEDLGRDLSLDLTALFNLMKDDIAELLFKAEEENWTPERLIKEIEELV